MVPEPATAALQAVLVPPMVRSPTARPVTLSLKTRLYSIEVPLVGVALVRVKLLTVGAVRSTVTVVASAATVGPLLPTPSATVPTRMVSSTVPSAGAVALTVIV